MKTAAGPIAAENFWMLYPPGWGSQAGNESPDSAPSIANSPPSSPLFSVEDFEFNSEKEAWSVPSSLLLPVADLLPCSALFCNLPEIIQEAASRKEVPMPQEPSAPVLCTMIGDFCHQGT